MHFKHEFGTGSVRSYTLQNGTTKDVLEVIAKIPLFADDPSYDGEKATSLQDAIVEFMSGAGQNVDQTIITYRT